MNDLTLEYQKKKYSIRIFKVGEEIVLEQGEVTKRNYDGFLFFESNQKYYRAIGGCESSQLPFVSKSELSTNGKKVLKIRKTKLKDVNEILR